MQLRKQKNKIIYMDDYSNFFSKIMESEIELHPLDKELEENTSSLKLSEGMNVTKKNRRIDILEITQI